jgi:hypothetical protein
MRDKITVLFLASDPFRDRAPLRLDEEVRAIDRAVRKDHARERVELVAHFATRARDLQDALLRNDPQVVHFAGHGGDPGVLYLGDARGRPHPVGKEALATLFGILGEWIKVVVLNGRDTLPTVEALSGVVDYAIGMDRPLSDPCAVRFAEAFYGALAMGRTVPKAFELAVGRMAIEGAAEATIPVLRIRPGVDPDVPLVLAPAAALPSPHPAGEGGGDGGPVDAGRVSVFATLAAGETRFESHLGEKNGPRDRASARRFTFPNGRPN